MHPPPPPLPFVLPVLPALLTVIVLLTSCCGIAFLLSKRRAAAGGGAVSVGKGDKGGDKGGEPGPENAGKAAKSFRSRGCTDLLCLLLFCGFWLGMIYLFYLGLTVGDPYSVVYGKDYLGNRCGRGNFTDRPKVIFPRIDADVMEQSAVAASAPWRLQFYGLCVPHCPNVTDPTLCFGNPESCMSFDYGTRAQWEAAGGARYYYSVLPTISVINRCIPIANTRASAEPPRCAYPTCDNVTNPWMVCDATYPTLWVPQTAEQSRKCEVKFQNERVAKLTTQNPSPLVERLADTMGSAQRVIEGIIDAQTEIQLCGLLMPILLGFAWLVVLRFFAKTIIYAALIGIGGGLTCLTIYLFIITGLAQHYLSAMLASNLTKSVISQSQVYAAQSPIDLGSGLADGASIEGADAMATRLIPDDLAADAAASQQANPFLYEVAAYVMLLLSLIYWFLLMLWRKKIALAAALVKEASVVIRDRPMHILFPGWTLIGSIANLFFFVLGMLFLATADLTREHFTGGAALTSHATYAQSLAAMNESIAAAGGGAEGAAAVIPSGLFTVQNMSYVYFIFGFLWTNSWINAIAFTALSGSYCHWYFLRRDDKYATRFPLSWSVYRTFRYHLGSLAFGAFLIAVVQLARLFAAWLDKQTQGLQDKNKMLKLVMKCVQCCLYCLEKTVKFITGYCYIYVAMQGMGFCRACFATFKLIILNTAQLAVNTLVRTVLIVAQLVLIPLACYQLCSIVLAANGHFEPFYPSLVVAALALVITNVFGLVFGCVLDTLFVCCVRDKAEYKAAFMSDRLYVAYGFDPAERAGGGGGGEGGGGSEPQETTQTL